MAGHGRTGAPGSGRWTAQLLAAVAVLALAAGGASAATPAHNDKALQCCRTPGAFPVHRNCSDGTTLQLDCPAASAMFRIDPELDVNDAFELSADGKSLFIWNTTMQEFCLLPPDTGGNVMAIVCYEYTSQDDPRPAWWFDATATMSWLSVACLALTLLAHVLLRELRDLQGRCHMGAVTSLGLGLFMLAFLHNRGSEQPEPYCTTMAFLTYYCFLSAFFWLNITSFNVWRSVVLEHKRFRERTLFAWYCAVCLGAPMVFLLLLLAAHLQPDKLADHVKPGIGEVKCWFRDDQATWLWFYWPLAVLLGTNVVYFVWTTARLWQQYGDSNQGRRRLIRRRFLLSLKLFLIMGISWIFELISSKLPGNYAWYLTDAINALQGVVILLLLVVFRRRVWRAAHRLRPCGLRPPEQWAYPSDMCDAEAVSTDSEEEADDGTRRLQELKDMSATNGHALLNGHAALKAAS